MLSISANKSLRSFIFGDSITNEVTNELETPVPFVLQ